MTGRGSVIDSARGVYTSRVRQSSDTPFMGHVSGGRSQSCGHPGPNDCALHSFSPPSNQGARSRNSSTRTRTLHSTDVERRVASTGSARPEMRHKECHRMHALRGPIRGRPCRPHPSSLNISLTALSLALVHVCVCVCAYVRMCVCVHVHYYSKVTLALSWNSETQFRRWRGGVGRTILVHHSVEFSCRDRHGILVAVPR